MTLDMFLDTTQKTWSMKDIIDKKTSLKFKNFVLWKTILRKWKKQPSNWENIFEKHISDKGLVFKIYQYKALLKSTIRKHTIPLKIRKRCE